MCRQLLWGDKKSATFFLKWCLTGSLPKDVGVHGNERRKRDLVEVKNLKEETGDIPWGNFGLPLRGGGR